MHGAASAGGCPVAGIVGPVAAIAHPIIVLTHNRIDCPTGVVAVIYRIVGRKSSSSGGMHIGKLYIIYGYGAGGFVEGSFTAGNGGFDDHRIMLGTVGHQVVDSKDIATGKRELQTGRHGNFIEGGIVLQLTIIKKLYIVIGKGAVIIIIPFKITDKYFGGAGIDGLVGAGYPNPRGGNLRRAKINGSAFATTGVEIIG